MPIYIPYNLCLACSFHFFLFTEIFVVTLLSNFFYIRLIEIELPVDDIPLDFEFQHITKKKEKKKKHIPNETKICKAPFSVVNFIQVFQYFYILIKVLFPH